MQARLERVEYWTVKHHIRVGDVITVSIFKGRTFVVTAIAPEYVQLLDRKNEKTFKMTHRAILNTEFEVLSDG